MRIAILGTRGIPANYGGFETFAEELAWRLVARGHAVTVYGRNHYVPPGLTEHRGAHLVVLPTIRHKYLDTVVHTMLATSHALTKGYDVALVCNAANAVFTGWPRLFGTRVALNVDGIERRRRKWNALGRAWYLVSERLAVWFPNATVTDARVIQQYYLERYQADTTFIPYGGDLPRADTTRALDAHGLRPGRYLLYVSRLEPENNAHAVIEGFRRAGLDLQLAIVGDAPYAGDYVQSLRNAAAPGIVFTGALYGEGYRELQSHAYAYVHATEVGGTHPALVEAMGFGNCVIVNDVPENREVCGDAALYFTARDPDSLATLLRQASCDPAMVTALGQKAAARAREMFSWEKITDQYEALFRTLLDGVRQVGK